MRRGVAGSDGGLSYGAPSICSTSNDKRESTYTDQRGYATTEDPRRTSRTL